MLARMWRKGYSSTLLVGMQIDAATVENSREVSHTHQKHQNRLPRDLAVPLVATHPKDTKS